MADMYLGNESGGFDLVGTTNIKNIDFEEVKISKEDYENLSEEEQKKGVYLVTGLDDIEDGGGRADLISYDNTNSGLGSTNVQGAIDELNSNLGGISFVLNEDGTIAGYTSGGADTVHPFSGSVPSGNYLYYYGNEIKSVTGGWNAYAYKVSTMNVNATKPTITKEAGLIKFYIDATSSNYKYGTLFTENAIDLTNYSYIKIIIYFKVADARYFHITSTKANNFTNTKNITLAHGENAIDISSLSGSYYLAFGGGGSSATDYIIESVELIE